MGVNCRESGVCYRVEKTGSGEERDVADREVEESKNAQFDTTIRAVE